MRKIFTTLLLLILSQFISGQSIDDPFSKKKMRKDLEVFKNIRIKANSGLYKYRSKKEIDSMYNWAEKEIENLNTYRDFYNLICLLTDFEGSLHNDTYLPSKLFKSMKAEQSGYFPYPLKLIEGRLVLNFKTAEIPLGSEILSVNNHKTGEIIPKFYKYYTTDGINKTGKTIGINRNFSRYYRLHYGLEDTFTINFRKPNTQKVEKITIKSVGYSTYYNNFKNRHSYNFDRLAHGEPKLDEIYTYKNINATTGILTINSFSIGSNEDSEEHKQYAAFLDSVFVQINKSKIKNLIVDVRQNGGGTDPNDLISYSYLTQRNFTENKEAWISFKKIPYLRYYDSSIPKFLRPFGVRKYNKLFQKEFPIEKDGKFYQSGASNDHKIRNPNKNAFKGKIYLLISPRVASAGSLFAAMVAGNSNTITIGEETMGGYYGHNGHAGFDYLLPKSKIGTSFFMINLEQDVPKKANQFYNRGIIPDYNIPQTFEDFMKNEDTQMNFTLDLIKNNE